MTDDPLHRYAALINRAHAPRDLSRAVLDRIDREQHEPARPSGPRHQAREADPRPSRSSDTGSGASRWRHAS